MKLHAIEQSTFKAKLGAYKQAIDEDIAAYSKHTQASTLQNYGANARMEIDEFLSILARGGKRIRGALAMQGYEMCGGTNGAMILQAARALEMLHAYILMIDDIQDRSPVRRGGPTAHIKLAEYHRRHELAGDAAHFGVSIAINSALSGAHAAQTIFANLDADAQLRLNVLSIVNRTMLITAHGQTSDIMNEVVAEVSQDEIERVLEWKTAEYTFLNPLCVGMVLAGADCDSTNGIRDYALHTGKAFQITDDILGTFGSEFESGKSPLDDVREGKRTLLVAHTLEHANHDNKNFLLQMLGKEDITPAQFERCKTIIQEAGSVEYARARAEGHIQEAIISLEANAHYWTAEGVTFLRDLATYILVRTS
jgi:geranylgeranyl diphosphate synthase type I